jgi:branched-chain amino acid transport system permease protein
MNGAILVLIVLFLPKGLWDPQRVRQWFAPWFGAATRRGAR